MFTDDDGVRGLVAEQVAAAQELAAQAQMLRARIDRASGQAQSRGGLVRVQVDATGRLLGVEFAAGALELRPQQLGQVVMDTAAAAHRVAARHVAALARDAFGADSDLTARVIAEVGSRVPGGHLDDAGPGGADDDGDQPPGAQPPGDRRSGLGGRW